jgi:hypothetical protein
MKIVAEKIVVMKATEKMDKAVARDDGGGAARLGEPRCDPK